MLPRYPGAFMTVPPGESAPANYREDSKKGGHKISLFDYLTWVEDKVCLLQIEYLSLVLSSKVKVSGEFVNRK